MKPERTILVGKGSVDELVNNSPVGSLIVGLEMKQGKRVAGIYMYPKGFFNFYWDNGTVYTQRKDIDSDPREFDFHGNARAFTSSFDGKIVVELGEKHVLDVVDQLKSLNGGYEHNVLYQSDDLQNRWKQPEL